MHSAIATLLGSLVTVYQGRHMLPPTGAAATFNRPMALCCEIIVWLLQSTVRSCGDGEFECPDRDEAGVKGNAYPLLFCRLLMLVTRIFPATDELSLVTLDAEGDEGGV